MTITKISIEQPLQQLLIKTIKMRSPLKHSIQYFVYIRDINADKSEKFRNIIYVFKFPSAIV